MVALDLGLLAAPTAATAAKAAPRLARTVLGKVERTKLERAGYTTEGAPCNLSVIRTLQSALGRRVALAGAIGSRMEELRAWHAALPENTRAAFRMWLEGTSPWDLMQYVHTGFDRIPGTPAEKAARRIAVFKDLALNPFGGGPGYWLKEEYYQM